MIIRYQADYIEDGGVLSKRITFRKKDEHSGSGKSVWHWSDGIMNWCGEYSFTAQRKQK